MKITVCKEVKYKSSGILSMCSSRDTLVVFRKNKTMEMIRDTSFQTYLYYEVEHPVIQSTFITEDLCLMLGEDGGLRMIDIRTLKVTNIKLEYSVGRFEGGDYESNTPFYCFTKNGMIVSFDLKESFQSKIVQKFSRPVSFILKKEILLIGDEKGRITFLSQTGGIQNELEVSEGSINSIIHITEDKYAALTGAGELVYFDSKLNSVLQKIKVRETSLNCGLFIQNGLHLVGKDSRIICYKKTKGIFQKSYQMDKHALEINSMSKIGETIFTGGLDGIIGIFVPGEHRYLGLRTFDKIPSGRFLNFGLQDCAVLINNLDFAEIYKLEGPLKNKNSLESSYNTAIKLDKKFLEDLSVKNIKATNQARIYFGSKVYCYDTDGKILVYSDKDATKLVELTPKIQQDSYFRFPPSKYIFVAPDFVCLQSTDLKIRIIDRKDFSNVHELAYEDLEEEIKVLEGLIIFKKSKRVFKIKENKKGPSLEEETNSLANVEGLILDVLKIGDQLVVLSKKDIMRYSLYRIKDSESRINFSTYDILTGLLEHNQDIFYTTQSAITNSKNGSTYDLGSIIYSCGSLGSSLAVLKDDWSYLRNELGEKVVKDKWKSR